MLYLIRVGADGRWRMDLLWLGVGLAKSWYSPGSFIRCTDQVT
jgi:hypothetical protein